MLEGADILPVSALTGQRFHGRGLTEWFVSDLPFALVATVHDVQMVLNYLETRKDLDASTAGIFGQGSGGTIAALKASVEIAVFSVLVCVPGLVMTRSPSTRGENDTPHCRFGA